ASLAARYPGLRLEQHLDDGATCAGDVMELRRVVDALLGNAAEAAGGKGHVVVSCTVDGKDVRLRVTDDGLGMTDEVRGCAFDPFFSTKGPLASGLGLPIAYGIVQRHGGAIELESAPG